MIDFDKGDPKRIQHFLKVHSFAKLIGEGENLDEKTLFILEADALVNLFEDGISAAAIETALDSIFRTKTGIHLCKTMNAV